jgi:hypothetical protein
MGGGLSCAVRTRDELTIVCAEDLVAPEQEGGAVEGGWVALQLIGPFPFTMTGVLASFLAPLAEAQIPIFAISTFDTDYVLVKHSDAERAVKALAAAGHEKCEK